MDLKGSETEKNLIEALKGEALAHLKYQFYRSKIGEYSKEYEQIFDEIIHNEKEHGKIWFKLLNDGSVPDDLANLEDAFIGERYEHIGMYPKFSDVAKEEGFDEISELFLEVARIEGYHMNTFLRLLGEIESLDNFLSNTDVEWKCLNCGYQYEGDEALLNCPVCNHPIKYFIKL